MDQPSRRRISDRRHNRSAAGYGRIIHSGQSRHFGRRPTTSGLPLETDIVRPVAMSQRCQNPTSRKQPLICVRPGPAGISVVATVNEYPRGLCFSAVVLCLLGLSISHTNRQGSLQRWRTCVPLAQCHGRTRWPLPEAGPSREQAAGSDNDEAHGHEVDTGRHSPPSENR